MKNYQHLSDEEKKELEAMFVREPEAFYEKAETDLLANALKKTDTERFLTMTRLMKRSVMLSRAKIIHATGKQD
ncbi:MAG TPA: hypothetical protein PKC69_00175 [Chitinophagaceae bacterium]|nr:hypothetical protein [Chitinophagaceae bacterium]